MSEENGKGNDSQSGVDPQADNEAAEEISSLPVWAQNLIKRINHESATNRVKAKTAEENAKAERERLQAEALAEQGKFKELYEKTAAELKAEKQYRERAAALEAKIMATNEARIARIPEGLRTVIPMDYTPDRLSEWLDANETLLAKSPAPPRDGGRGSDIGRNDLPKLSDVELELAKIAGVTPDVYAKRKSERGQPIELKK